MYRRVYYASFPYAQLENTTVGGQEETKRKGGQVYVTTGTKVYCFKFPGTVLTPPKLTSSIPQIWGTQRK